MPLAQDEVAAGRKADLVGPYDLAPAEGRTGDEVRFHRKQLSDNAIEAYASLASTHAEGTLNKARGAGNYITRGGLLPAGGADPAYIPDYVKVVNHHLRQGEISRRLLAGGPENTPEKLITWLKSTEGRAIRRRLVHGADTPESLVQVNVENINHLIPDTEMRKVFSQRTAVPSDVEKMFGTGRQDWPPVNGEQVAYSMGRGPTAEALDKLRTGFFKYANAMPDAVWGRHPMYRALYRGHMRQELTRLDPKLEGTLTDVEQRVLEEQGRIFAKSQMKRLMFDASNKSNLGEFLRFTSPFFTAWEDVLHKYGRMVMRDPSLIPHAWQVWSSPNDASFLEVVDSTTGKPVQGKDSQLNSNESIVVPVGALKKYFGVGGMRVSKAGFNVVLQGSPWILPGAGPLAQAATQDLAVGLDSPTIGSVAQKLGILPFGIQDKGKLGWGYLKSSAVANATPSDAQLGRMKAMILQTEQYEYQKRLEKYDGVGPKPLPPTAKEINDKTNNLTYLRFWTSMTSPASIQYTSPYQFYIDEFHAYDQQIGTPAQIKAGTKKYKDQLEASAAFQEKYGDDLYLFTMSQSQNRVGIAATKKAYSAAGKVSDLIAKYPDYGWYFVGPDSNNGTFDRNVYGLETMKKVSPTSTQTYRGTYPDAFDALKANHAEVGWLEYTQMSDLLEVERQRRGLPSMQVAAAAGLRKIKKDWIESNVTGPDAPAWGDDWFNDFRDSDASRTHKFLTAAKAATEDPRLAGRKDIATMSDYLEGRALFKKEMKARGINALPQGNEDANGVLSFGQSKAAGLALIWAQFTTGLVERDITFGNTYQRYLANDNLQDGI